MKKGKSLSGNSKRRHPEEFPKKSRRNLDEGGRGQKRAEDTRERQQEGGSFPYQKRVITIPRLANKQDLEIDTDQERGGENRFLE